jgi:hypothetical protein
MFSLSANGFFNKPYFLNNLSYFSYLISLSDFLLSSLLFFYLLIAANIPALPGLIFN